MMEEMREMENSKEYSRWLHRGLGLFIPSENVLVKEKLPAGLYNVVVKETYTGTETSVNMINTDCSHLLKIDQPEEEYIHKLLDQFCSKKVEFEKLNIAYKTGLLLHGIQGGGKTSILSSIIQKIIALDGVCFLLKNIGDVYSFDKFYKTIYRKIEPNRLIVNIFEDIDGMATGDSETTLINILDGIGDCNSVINIATTNYPESLSARLINRPGRFDRRIEIKPPSPENRKKYLLLRLPEEFQKTINVNLWVSKTDNFTLAQLNEIVKSVLLLDENFDDMVKKISEMCQIPKSRDYDQKGTVGFRK